MAKYRVLAQAFRRTDGFPVGFAREEEIDTLTNNLFKRCESIMDVKEIYEEFWNCVPTIPSKEVVFVQQVREVTLEKVDEVKQ